MSHALEDLAAILRETGAAHHAAFAGVDGHDPDWAIWYAEFAHPRIAVFGFGISKARLVECFLKAEVEHQARAPDRDWSEFYAEMFLEHLAPASGQDDKLALYMTPVCPFCLMVIGVIGDLDVDVDLRDVSADPRHRKDLIAARGRATVPVLRITAPDGTERWMPESRDIARFLRETFG